MIISMSMCSATQQVAQYHAFLGLTYFVDTVSEYLNAGIRCNVLAAYINHLFDNHPGLAIYAEVSEIM